ncbi:MAG: SGNH/GDSL hydrolase family protein [Jatrophihabitans sp.]
MRRSRIVVTFVAALSTLTLVLGITSAQAAGANYVSLGDSYSSGVGSGSYISSSGSCLRSTLAYSQLWANAHGPSSYRSVACSGATTATVTSGQLSALTSSTTLVSISVGGNDVGFAKVMQDCVLHGTDTCTSEINAAEAKARSALPGLLGSLYSKIRSHSPGARVVVLSYPVFYHTGVWYCVGLSETSRKKINEGAGVLDSVIQAAAAAHGFAFADVRSRFAAGHQICDGSSSWLHNVDFDNLVQSYHPTAAGQSGGYLPAFSAAA